MTRVGSQRHSKKKSCLKHAENKKKTYKKNCATDWFYLPYYKRMQVNKT